MTRISEAKSRSSLYPIMAKVRKKGLSGCWQAAVRILGQWLRGPIYRRWVRIGWVFPALRLLFNQAVSSERRILAIYDFRTRPYTVGELLFFQAFTLVLKIENKAEKVDIAWLCDPDKPARWDQGITRENYYFHLSTLLPLAHVNPCRGSFFLVDSPAELEALVANNADRYVHIEPPFAEHVFRPDYDAYYQRMCTFYKKNGFVPRLSCQPAMGLWARSFIAEMVYPSVPVVLQLRSNQVWAQNRNAQLNNWIEFIADCQTRYQVKFVVVGARDEIASALRGCENVILSKDHGTTVEQDMAIIQSSFMYLGTDSGPNIMAWFGSRPYLLFMDPSVHPYAKLIKRSRFPWATPEQRLVWKPQTTAVLIREFADLMGCLEPAAWASDFARSAVNSGNELRRMR